MNRVINIFQFRYWALYKETSFEDLLAITTLEVLEPKLYKWIYKNKYILCSGSSLLSTTGDNKKSDHLQKYRDEFQKMELDVDVAISCISTLFPAFENDIDEYSGRIYQPTPNIRSKMRIADSSKFDTYFMFDFDDAKIPRNLIDHCVFTASQDELYKYINDFNEQGSIPYFLDEARSLIAANMMSDERLGLIASTLLASINQFEGNATDFFFGASASIAAEHLVIDILRKITTKNERYRSILTVLDESDKDNLGVIARILSYITRAYGKFGSDSENSKNQLISEYNLNELEDKFMDKLQDALDSGSILDINKFADLFYYWRYLDEKKSEDYLDELFKTEKNKLKFICAIGGKWVGTDEVGWYFSPQHYSSYMSKDSVLHLIEEGYKYKMDDFTEIEQLKLASFVLNYDRDEMSPANEEEAHDLLHRWKEEKE